MRRDRAPTAELYAQSDGPVAYGKRQPISITIYSTTIYLNIYYSNKASSF
jgi:hypothetical protein